MSIMGAAVGLPAPGADWAQTDESRADFIRNKPDVEAVKTLAREGKTLAEKTLPKAGGAMTGAIDMGGNPVTGLGTPTGSGDAASKSYVDGKHVVKTATITTTWKGSAAPYTQSVTVSGILSTMEKEGLIERKVNPDSRRETLVYLTELGHEKRKEVMEMYRDLDQEVFAGFDDEDFNRLLELMGRIQDVMEDHSDGDTPQKELDIE